MEFTGSRTLPVPRDAAWAALNDPEMLKASIPGCESIERVGESEYALGVVAAIGPVKARFKGKLSIADAVPPERYAIVFEGQGGPAGFAKGRANVELAYEGAQTRLDYRASAQVGGRIAQVGSRLIDAAASKMTDEFFAAFSSALAAKHGAAPPEPPSESPRRRVPIWLLAVLAAFIAAVVTILLRSWAA
jgi:carbon monoxide dehydrogenase subunit G